MGGYQISPDLIAEIRRLRYAEGLSAAQTARRLGLTPTSIYKYAPLLVGEKRVSNEPFRVAYVQTGMRPSALATRLGWFTHGGGTADTSRVLRALGVSREMGRGKFRVRRTVTLRTALALAEALDLDPVDIGL